MTQGHRFRVKQNNCKQRQKEGMARECNDSGAIAIFGYFDLQAINHEGILVADRAPVVGK